MIYIDLPADLNLEDDEGRNLARLADAVTPDSVTQGAVLAVGTPHAWSWAPWHGTSRWPLICGLEVGVAVGRTLEDLQGWPNLRLGGRKIASLPGPGQGGNAGPRSP